MSEIQWKTLLKEVAKQIPNDINQTEASSLFCKFFKQSRSHKCLLCDNYVYGNLQAGFFDKGKLIKRAKSSSTFRYKLAMIKSNFCKECIKKYDLRSRGKESLKQKESYSSKKYRHFNKNVKQVPTIFPQNSSAPMDVLTEEMTEEKTNELRAMNYRDFLKTDYWKIIRTHIINTRQKCQICGSRHRFNVHHKTYKNRGYEYLRLDDLVLLCHHCHQAIHARL